MYVIYFQGIFQEGYVKSSLFKKHGTTIPLSSHTEAINLATKFRFKWTADLFCGIFNKIGKHNYDLRNYSVKKINKNGKNRNNTIG